MRQFYPRRSASGAAPVLLATDVTNGPMYRMVSWLTAAVMIDS